MIVSDQVAIARPREWFSPAEVATMLGRATYTVRQWCRQGRIQARKRSCGRGLYLAWEIHADELWHYCEHGLRPAAASPAEGAASC